MRLFTAANSSVFEDKFVIINNTLCKELIRFLCKMTYSINYDQCVHMNIAALTIKYHPKSTANCNVNAASVLLVGGIY